MTGRMGEHSYLQGSKTEKGSDAFRGHRQMDVANGCTGTGEGVSKQRLKDGSLGPRPVRTPIWHKHVSISSGQWKATAGFCEGEEHKVCALE